MILRLQITFMSIMGAGRAPTSLQKPVGRFPVVWKLIEQVLTASFCEKE